MSLLQALNLPKPPAKPKANTAELDRAIAETTQAWKTVTDEAAKQELAQAVKEATAQREAAAEMGDATGRAAFVKDKAEKLSARKLAITNRLRVGVGMKPAEKKKDEEKDGSFKPKFNTVTDKGKLGLGGGAEAELEQKTKKGDVVTCTASFEGKAWVETKPVDAYDPTGDMEVSFHLVVGGKARAGAKRKREEGTGGGVSGSASVELELSFKRTMKPEETKAYQEAVRSAKGGGWEEVRALQLAATGSMAEARAIVAKLGGKVRAAQEDDETEEKLTGTLEGGADVSSKKGAFGITLAAGASTSGSLSRKVAFKDGCWWITLSATTETTGRGAVGFSVEGVGMTQSKDKSSHAGRAVTFVIDPKKPERKPLLEKVLAARSVEQMLDLRAKNPGVASFDVKTKGDAGGDGTAVSLLGVGIGGESRSFGSETEIDGPDGKTLIHEGGNTLGAHAIVGDKPIGGSTKTDRFSGGAGPDNKGFGETSSTDRSGDLMGGLGAVVDKLKQSPLTTAKNLYDGKEELSKEVVHVEGAAFSDESYGQLAARAKEGDGKWIKYWRGSMNTLADWRATRPKIVAAGQDRQKIAKCVADFERGSGRGRHETVRNAISGTEVAFELPPAIASKKSYFDNLVVNDPLPAALAAPTPADAVKKLEAIERQLTGFRNDMSKSKDDFAHLADYQDMVDRIEARRVATAATLKTARAKLKAAEDEAKGINQFTPAGPDMSSMDSQEERDRIAEAVRRVNRFKQAIDDHYGQEQGLFSRWEEDLKGFTVFGVSLSKPDLMKIIGHEKKLRELYPGWDKDREALRKALTEAGGGHDPAEADVLQPDRKRYRDLRARGPQAGFNQPDGV